MTVALENRQPRDPGQRVDVPRRPPSVLGAQDRVFRGILRGAGVAVLGVMGCVGVFLTYRAWQALRVAKLSFLTTARWQPDAAVRDPAGHHFGIAAVLVGTILIGLVAVAVAVPLALGAALYLSEYAPRKARRFLISVIDLMAAVPSILYGIFGFFFLQGRVIGVARWISTYFSWIPIFKVDGARPHDPLATATVFTSSTFIAGLVVGVMVTPIMSSIMREAFSQAPMGEREGAYALGATRWGMVRTVVLPFGRGGIIGGTMLGLGRALGETIAVLMIVALLFAVQPHLLQNGGSSVAELIAARYGEATPFGTSALMAAGLALFVMTLVINFIASSIVIRSRSGSASEA